MLTCLTFIENIENIDCDDINSLEQWFSNLKSIRARGGLVNTPVPESSENWQVSR